MPPRDAGEWAEDGGERRRRRTAQTAATSRPASPLRCAPCARDWAFVWRRSTATPRGCARRSRSGETACSPVIRRCSCAQPPAPAVPALSSPFFFLYPLQGFALFFILAPSGPCERQLRYAKRPLPANQPHTPAPGRAPPSQQDRPPRFPTSSPNGPHVRAQSRARRAPNRGVAP